MKMTFRQLDEKNRLIIWINAIESWDGLEQISLFIINECKGKVLKKSTDLIPEYGSLKYIILASHYIMTI